MAARAAGRAERGAVSGALPTPVRRPGVEGRGRPTRRRRAAPSRRVPMPGPQAGRSPGGNAGRGPGARKALRQPGRRHADGGAAVRPFSFPSFLEQKGTGFPFSEISSIQLYFDRPFPGISIRLERETELGEKVELGPSRDGQGPASSGVTSWTLGLPSGGSL